MKCWFRKSNAELQNWVYWNRALNFSSNLAQPNHNLSSNCKAVILQAINLISRCWISYVLIQMLIRYCIQLMSQFYYREIKFFQNCNKILKYVSLLYVINQLLTVLEYITGEIILKSGRKCMCCILCII